MKRCSKPLIIVLEYNRSIICFLSLKLFPRFPQSGLKNPNAAVMLQLSKYNKRFPNNQNFIMETEPRETLNENQASLGTYSQTFG